MIRRVIHEQRWTVLFGAILGLMIAPVGRSGWDAALSYYDTFRPIVSMDAEYSGRAGNAVNIKLTGQKRRDCAFVRLHAYSVDAEQEMVPIYIRRLDRIENGQTRPVGKHDFGEWVLWPVDGTANIVIYAQHDCDGRLVQTRVASVIAP